MSWKSQAHKTYEERVVSDSLARLATQMNIASLPFTREELKTLAKRARESFRAFQSAEKRERLARYKTHLSTQYGEACVGPDWSALEQINNEIGYEEK